MKNLQRLLRDENGGPTIEFAVVALFASLSVPAVIDVMTLLNSKTELSSATRAGMQYALKYPTDAVGIETTVRDAAGANEISVNSRQFCECNHSVNSCSAACATGVTMMKYSEIVATHNISQRFNYENVYPHSLTTTITVRTQ